MRGKLSNGWNLAQDRCTESDYRQLFDSSSAELYGLCLTLTADEDLAKVCFDDALQRAVKNASSVFREWMWTWARRQIIKACITALRPEIQSAARSISATGAADVGLFGSDQGLAAWETPYGKVFQLDVLSRFVFVLRRLEAYPAREVALLLEVDLATLAAAHAKAVETMASGTVFQARRCWPEPVDKSDVT